MHAKHTNIIKNSMLIVSLMLISAACVKKEQTRGYMTDFAKFEQVEKGMSEAEVLAILGSPSAKSQFGTPTWYYIGMRLEQVAFLDPEVQKQKVFSVTFKDGKISDIADVDENSRREIVFSDQETPTEGNEVTVLQQLLGNLGRFDPSSGGRKGPAVPR